MSRLKLNMSMEDVMYTMSEGNPGALNVLCALLSDDIIGGFSTIMGLDGMGIYGSQIFVCAKDICGGDMEVFKEKIADKTLGKELQQRTKCLTKY